MFDATKGNTIETHVRRPTPVGVFVGGDTPEGVSDMSGNAEEWTSSAWGGEDERVPEYGYPYDAHDGREDIHTGPACRRVMRGGSWDSYQGGARAAFRRYNRPVNRSINVGYRCVLSSPISGEHCPLDAA